VSVDVASVLKAGLQYQEAGFIQEAERSYRQVLADYPGHAGASYLLGTLAERCGRRDMAVEFLRAAVDAEPGEPRYLIHLGGLLVQQGRLDEALALFQVATRNYPDRGEFHEKLGLLYHQLSQVKEAIACYRRALASSPLHVQAAINLGVLLIQEGQPEEAVAFMTHAAGLAPMDAGVHTILGSNLVRLGKFSEGIAAFQRALELQPATMQAHAGLAAAYLQAGDAVSALEAARAGRLQAGFATPLLASEYYALHELGEDEAAQAIYDFDHLIFFEPLPAPPEYPSLDAFNAVLADELRAHPTLRWEPIGRETRSGYHSGLLHEQPLPLFRIFERLLRQRLDDFISRLPAGPLHPLFSRKPRDYGLRCWTCILETGGFQGPHIHAPGWLSGNYYVQLPSAIGNTAEDTAGWIEFGRPPASYPLTRPPRVRALQPRAGMMVLFPSYFVHRTIPFEADGQQRVSIGFDVTI
jgi:uncharacterized protein (TIGR02466 family)